MLRDTKTVDTIKPFLSSAEGQRELTFELPAADFNALIKDTIEVYNLLAKILGDQKILKTKELAKMTTNNMRSLQAEKDPVARFFLLHAYIKQLIRKLGEGFKSRTPAGAEQARLYGHLNSTIDHPWHLPIAATHAAHMVSDLRPPDSEVFICQKLSTTFPYSAAFFQGSLPQYLQRYPGPMKVLLRQNLSSIDEGFSSG